MNTLRVTCTEQRANRKRSAAVKARVQQTENGSERDLAGLCTVRKSNEEFGLLRALVTPCRQPDVSKTSPPKKVYYLAFCWFLA
jgi:hypothetical protein